MATYTIVTTADQEKALTAAFEQAKTSTTPQPPPLPPTVPATQAEYLQQQVDAFVLAPMVGRYAFNAQTVLVTTLSTIPVANRPEALNDLKLVVTDNGGTLPPAGIPDVFVR
jgi:hypothetical protein